MAIAKQWHKCQTSYKLSLPCSQWPTCFPAPCSLQLVHMDSGAKMHGHLLSRAIKVWWRCCHGNQTWWLPNGWGGPILKLSLWLFHSPNLHSLGILLGAANPAMLGLRNSLPKPAGVWVRGSPKLHKLWQVHAKHPFHTTCKLKKIPLYDFF